MKKFTKKLLIIFTVLLTSALFTQFFVESARAADTTCSDADFSSLINQSTFYDQCSDGSTSCLSTSTIVNGTVDRFLQVLAYQESGGNPTAINHSPGATASGKYQYIDRTWQGRVSLYGPSGAYPRAYMAPEEIQDAVAFIEYTQKFHTLNGDFFQMAISHYLGSPTTDPTILDTVPKGGNTITPRQYAERLLNNMASGVGSNIPMKYAQAPEFETWIAKVGGLPNGSGSGTTGCAPTASTSAGKIVQIAQAELAAGANERDSSYLKYTGGVRDKWCAYFVSWVLDKAGKPFENGTIAAVQGVLDYARSHNYFHPRGEAGFQPQPGDIVIYKEGLLPYESHVNIVISYDANSKMYTSIGGNEGDTIKQRTWPDTLSAITGFMRLP